MLYRGDYCLTFEKMPRNNLSLMFFLVNLRNIVVKGAPSRHYSSLATQLRANVLCNSFVKRLNCSLLQSREISGIKAFVETPRSAFGRGKHGLLLFLIQNAIIRTQDVFNGTNFSIPRMIFTSSFIQN